MKYKIKQEKGVTMMALVLTVIVLVVLTNVLIYNAQDNIYINSLTNLYNDISMLREKVSSYYEEYGALPAEIKYTIPSTSGLSSVLSTQNDTGDFYVIDLEAMQGITLNYGKDYENVKNGEGNANSYTDLTDLYIINENSHNIFYVEGIKIKENDTTKTYYTDYIKPDQTVIDLRYIDGILIPDGCYYIGKTDGSIVISTKPGEKIGENSGANQYTWTKQISELEKIPDSVDLLPEENQIEYQFIKSVNTYKGYFKNSKGNVKYVVIDEEKWSEAYTKEMEYEDRNGDKVTIPEGFRVSMSPTMNTVENGFVVKDSNDNEWVWVVVPESVFTTAKNNTDYDNIKADLIEYAKDYRKGTIRQSYNAKDEWYDGCGLTEKEYNDLYNTMLTSVYTNCGFWISRYEIGDATATKNYDVRSKDSGTNGEPVSKANQVPYTFIECADAQNLSEKMSTQGKNASLLFGIQWDLTCKFLEENANLTKEQINSDSSICGNYADSSILLNRGKYLISEKWIDFSEDTENYVEKNKTSIDSNYKQLITTGASEQTKTLNIYDLAGNVLEWTLENSNIESKPYLYRAGSFAYGKTQSISFRYNEARTTICLYRNLGFRVTLY